MASNLDSAPDATNISTPMLMPIGFEDNFFLFWLLQIVLAIVIQLVFNRWLINRLQQIRARN